MVNGGRDLVFTTMWVLGLCLAVFAIGWHLGGWIPATAAIGCVLFAVGCVGDLKGL